MPFLSLPPPTPAIIHHHEQSSFDGSFFIIPSDPNVLVNEGPQQLFCQPGFCFETSPNTFNPNFLRDEEE